MLGSAQDQEPKMSYQQTLLPATRGGKIVILGKCSEGLEPRDPADTHLPSLSAQVGEYHYFRLIPLHF